MVEPHVIGEVFFITTYLGLLSTIAVLTLMLVRHSTGANVMINVNNPIVLSDTVGDDDVVAYDVSSDDDGSADGDVGEVMPALEEEPNRNEDDA